MRTRLLSLVLLVVFAFPVFAQDGQEGAAPPPPAPLADALQVLDQLEGEGVALEIRQALERLAEMTNSVVAIRQDLDDTKTDLATTLGDLEERLSTLRRDYGRESADDEEGTSQPPSLENVSQYLRDLSAAIETDRAVAETERAKRRREALRSTRAEAADLQRKLGATYALWKERSLAAAPEGAWTEEREEAWRGLRELHQDLLTDLLRATDEAISTSTDSWTLRGQIRTTREATIALLRRENLLLRGKSDVTLDALAQGVEDVTQLPSWVATVARDVAAPLGRGHYTGELVRWAGASLLAMLLLVLARRRVRRSYRPPEELATDVDRSKDLLWRLLGPTVWAAIVAVPILFASWLIDSLPPGWAHTLHVLGLSVGLLWAGRAWTRRLLPAGDSWSPVELDLRSRMLVRTGLSSLLWLSALLVPFGIALAELGYANPGARQAVWTLYKLLAVVILLIFVLRRSVLLSILPAETTGVGRVLRRIVGVVHPVLVLVGPLLLALDFLQYDVLAEFLLRLVGGVLVAGAVGFFVFGAVWRGLAAWIRSIVTEPPDSTPETSRIDAALAIGRYVLLLIVLAGALFLMLLIKGGDLNAIHDLLDIELPFQGQIEGKHITWFNVLAGLALLTLFLTAVPKLKLALERFVLPRTSLDAALQYTISTLVGYVFAALGIYIALVQIFDLGALGYVFAALSVGIGFGLQEIVSNFVSGLILLFERPIKVGDLITVGTTEGWVTKINIRATTIQTRDNVTMLIPNKDFITQAVVNSVYGDSVLRVRVRVGVAYGSDTALVERLLMQAVKEHPLVLQDRRNEVNFTDFGGSSLDFTLLCWIPEAAEHMRVASALRFKIDKLFRENGVEIPFSQHDLHLRSIDDEAAAQLRGDSPRE